LCRARVLGNTTSINSIHDPRSEFENIETVIATSADTPRDSNIDEGSSVHIPSCLSDLQGATSPGKPSSGLNTSPSYHQEQEDQRPTPGPSPSASAVSLGILPKDLSDQSATVTAIIAAIDAARVDLFFTLTRKGNPKIPKTAALNLATAQRLVLAEHQRRITETCHMIMTADDDMRAQSLLLRLDKGLHYYCEFLFLSCMSFD
jgi:hypothetical protein